MTEIRRLEGRVAIVTGGASGIGLATARRLLVEGARVLIADRDEQAAVTAAGRLSTSGDVVGVRCDVSAETDVTQCVDLAATRFGRLDIVVNNAGVMVFKPLEDHTLADWNHVLGVDLLGAFLFLREALRRMSRGGAVVNVSSVHAIETTPLVASYAAAKAALVSLTRSAAIEAAPKGIRINAVLPGAIETPMLRENPNIKSGLEHLDPADVGRPEDVAAAVAFLVSDDAAFVQGAALLVDGGRLARL